MSEDLVTLMKKEMLDYLNVFRDYDINESGESVIDFYQDQLDAKVIDALRKTVAYIYLRYPTADSLVDYFQSEQPGKSFDRIQHWNVECLRDMPTPVHALYEALGDNFGYLMAASMRGEGIGMWELFDNFPCLNNLT